MRITLTDAGKRFNRDWIFRHFSYEFTSGQSYAIIGPNGSGKSTLLQLIAGAIQPNEGSVRYLPNQEPPLIGLSQNISPEAVHDYFSLSTPYLELIEEMTLVEFLNFHGVFKPFNKMISIQKAITLVGLEGDAHKQIRYFSSGMKQRLKLAQAFFSETPVVLLDEPCTNLDEEGVTTYLDLVREYTKDRLLVISSNDKQEYDFCSQIIQISQYKAK